VHQAPEVDRRLGVAEELPGPSLVLSGDVTDDAFNEAVADATVAGVLADALADPNPATVAGNMASTTSLANACLSMKRRFIFPPWAVTGSPHASLTIAGAFFGEEPMNLRLTRSADLCIVTETCGSV